jgi:hypothetical protein
VTATRLVGRASPIGSSIHCYADGLFAADWGEDMNDIQDLFGE